MNDVVQQLDTPPLPLDQMLENASQAAQFLKAIANEYRLMILCLLDGQELSVTELNHHLDLSQSALSQHLAVLRKDDLVQTRRESQTIYYSLKGDTAAQVIAVLHNQFCPEL